MARLSVVTRPQMYTFLSSRSPLHSLPPFLPVSSMMHEYPPENILWGPYALDWDEQAVRDYLSLLTPERMHLTVVSKVGAEEREGGKKGREGTQKKKTTPRSHFPSHIPQAFEEEAQKEAWAKEKWYGTLHKLEKLPEVRRREE